jgi:hypothetical protein
MFIRVISRLIAFLLLAESLFGALNFTQLISQLGIYTPLTIALILVRAGGECVSVHRRVDAGEPAAAGAALASYALAASAVLTSLTWASTWRRPWSIPGGDGR